LEEERPDALEVAEKKDEKAKAQTSQGLNSHRQTFLYHLASAIVKTRWRD